MREALLKQRLERVVVGVGNGVLAENPGEWWHAVRRALQPGQGIAQRRRVFAQADQGYTIRANHRTRRQSARSTRAVRKIQPTSRDNRAGSYEVRTVLAEGPARCRSTPGCG